MIPRELFKKIRHIEIRTKGLVYNIFGGEYHSAFKGRGIEFAEVRPYQVGDDVRTIDWNVSARMGTPYVKVFEEEREQTLVLAVDVSGSKDFGTRQQFKREMAAEICAVLAFSAIQNNDKVGLLLFSDQVELFVPPKKGKRHVLRLIRELFAHQPQSSQTHIASALHHLLHVLKRRSIVVLISDFLDEGFEKPLRAVARRHDTVAIQLEDIREAMLPEVGLVSLADAETGEIRMIDTSSRVVQQAFEAQYKERQHALRQLFRKTQLDHVRIRTGENYVEPLMRFFRQRHRT